MQGFSNLLLRISRLADLNPLAINITWGAGGLTRDQTLDLASLTQREYGVDTVMHLTCTNMLQGTVDDALRVCDSLVVVDPTWRAEPCIGCETNRNPKYLGFARRFARSRICPPSQRLLIVRPRCPEGRRILDPD
jgi:hypothetical protein